VWYVQACYPCDPQCRGCHGPSAEACIECINYKQGGDCVAACLETHFTDNRTKTCIACDRQCLTCYGPTAFDCVTCRNVKLYLDLDERGPSSPVRVFDYLSLSYRGGSNWVKFSTWCIIDHSINDSFAAIIYLLVSGVPFRLSILLNFLDVILQHKRLNCQCVFNV